MPVYTFSGKSASGEKISGERVAESKAALQQALRRERIQVTGAIKEKGKVGHVFGVVNDLTPQVVDGIRGGTIYGTSRQHFCDMAKKAVDLLVAVSQGKQVPPTTDTGTTFVTKGNLDTVLAEAKDES